jgi:hypothetical protein
MCLDSGSEINENVDRSAAAAQLLHGSKRFTANRFFDKTIQIVFGDNGVWGCNFEHSIAEALPHNLMNDFIYSFMKKNKQALLDVIDSGEKDQISPDKSYSELNFEISDQVKSQIAKSARSVYK